MKKKPVFDVAAFVAQLDAACSAERLSMRAFCDDAGVTLSTVSRMRAGNMPSVRNLVILFEHLGWNIHDFVATTSPKRSRKRK